MDGPSENLVQSIDNSLSSISAKYENVEKTPSGSVFGNRFSAGMVNPSKKLALRQLSFYYFPNDFIVHSKFFSFQLCDGCGMLFRELSRFVLERCICSHKGLTDSIYPHGNQSYVHRGP
ncbi:hypothetical protein YC2023_005544 [Brassica napus]